MHVIHWLFILTIMGSCFCKSEEYSRRIVIKDESDIKTAYETLDSCISESITLEDVTYNADIPLSKSEFDYLTELSAGINITSVTIKKALFYLQKKNRFSEIVLHVIKKNQHVYLHFDLIGSWIVDALKIKGFFVNRQQYQRYYLLAPGDIFDEEKHTHSCLQIRHALATNGYFNGHIISTLKKNYTNKTIAVVLTIKRGSSFSIQNVHLNIKTNALNTHEQAQLKKEIESLFLKNIFKSTYTKSVLDKTVRNIKQFLLQKGFFLSTIKTHETILHAKESVSIQLIIELPHKKNYIFVGNQFFSQKELLDRITALGSTTWLLPASVLAQELQHLYHNAGFIKAHIETHEEHNKAFFIITEGERFSIKELTFQGVQQFPLETLVQKSFKHSMVLQYCTAPLLQKIYDNILTAYAEQGFWNTRITDTTYFFPESESTQCAVEVTLSESVQSIINTIIIEGLEPYLTNKLYHLLQKDISYPFTLSRINTQQTIIESFLYSNNIYNATCSPQFDRHNTEITITWHIQQRASNPSRGKVIIRSNTQLPFNRLFAELTNTTSAKNESNANPYTLESLRELGIFSQIRLHQDPPSPLHQAISDEKPFILHLQEEKCSELRVRTGLAFCNISSLTTGNGITYSVGGNYIYRNPFEVGDQLICNVNISKPARLIEGIYRHPWLFKKPIRTTIQGYTSLYTNPGVTDQLQQLYQMHQHGILASFHRRYKQYIGDCCLGLDALKITLCEHAEQHHFCNSLAHALDFNSRLIDLTIPYCIIKSSLFANRIDDPLEPMQGSISCISAKCMIPLKQSNSLFFCKINLEHSFFIPISQKFVGSISAKAGYILTPTQLKNILPPERFYLGGAYSLRSYCPDMAPPLGTFVDCQGRKQSVPQGGRSMFLINAELRYNVYKNICITLFQDIGSLSNNPLTTIKNEQLLLATGIGIWYSTPVGPVRFQIGYNWKTIPELHPSYAWYLTLGHAF